MRKKYALVNEWESRVLLTRVKFTCIKKKKILPRDLSNFYNCSIDVNCFSWRKKKWVEFSSCVSALLVGAGRRWGWAKCKSAVLSLRPGKLLAAGWVAAVARDLRMEASEKGQQRVSFPSHCALGASPEKEMNLRPGPDNRGGWRGGWEGFISLSPKLSPETQTDDLGGFFGWFFFCLFVFKLKFRIDSWSLASCSFLGLRVTSQYNLTAWLIAMVSYIIIIKDVWLIP